MSLYTRVSVALAPGFSGLLSVPGGVARPEGQVVPKQLKKIDFRRAFFLKEPKLSG